MKAQEVITIMGDISSIKDSIKSYPGLDELFEKGMYVENFQQTALPEGKYLLTFVLRHYHHSQSKQE